MSCYGLCWQQVYDLKEKLITFETTNESLMAKLQALSKQHVETKQKLEEAEEGLTVKQHAVDRLENALQDAEAKHLATTVASEQAAVRNAQALALARNTLADFKTAKDEKIAKLEEDLGEALATLANTESKLAEQCQQNADLIAANRKRVAAYLLGYKLRHWLQRRQRDAFDAWHIETEVEANVAIMRAKAEQEMAQRLEDVRKAAREERETALELQRETLTTERDVMMLAQRKHADEVLARHKAMAQADFESAVYDTQHKLQMLADEYQQQLIVQTRRTVDAVALADERQSTIERERAETERLLAAARARLALESSARVKRHQLQLRREQEIRDLYDEMARRIQATIEEQQELKRRALKEQQDMNVRLPTMFLIGHV